MNFKTTLRLLAFAFLNASVLMGAGVPPADLPPKDKEEMSDDNPRPDKRRRASPLEITITDECPQKLRDAAEVFARIVANGDVEALKAFLKEADVGLVELLFGPLYMFGNDEILLGTPLHMATHEGETEMMQALLDLAVRHKAIRNRMFLSHNMTPLYIAAAFATTAEIQILLRLATEDNQFVDLILPACLQGSALSAAAGRGRTANLEFLLAFFRSHIAFRPWLANPILGPNPPLRAPFQYASVMAEVESARGLLEFARNNPSLAHLVLEQNNADENALYAAAFLGSEDIVDLILEFAEQNESLAHHLIHGTPGRNALHAAIDGNYIGIIVRILRSPFRAQFTRHFADFFRMGQEFHLENPELARVVWLKVIGLAPELVGAHPDPRLARLGRMESAVLGRDIDSVRQLLLENIPIDVALLEAMFRNLPELNTSVYEAFSEFMEHLKALRVEFSQNQMALANLDAVAGLWKAQNPGAFLPQTPLFPAGWLTNVGGVFGALLYLQMNGRYPSPKH